MDSPYLPIRGAYVRDKNDALILCQAAQEGIVHQASQRISIQQRKQLSTSGSLFVFEKSAAEMERWTDGRGWSRSRQLPDKFFVYFEDYTNSNTTSAGLSNDETLTPKRTKRNDPSDLIGALVGPLRYLQGFTPQVLIKKTITLKFPGKEWHVVSYFTVEDVLSGHLPAVGEHPSFQSCAMRVAGSSHSMGQLLPSPPLSIPMPNVRQGRMRSSTWSNGSAPPRPPTDVPPMPMPYNGQVPSRHIPCPQSTLQSRVIAPPRLDSLPRHHTFDGAIPIQGGLSSDPTSPIRRSGVPLSPLDTSVHMTHDRRASAPTYSTHGYAHSGANSPTSAGFGYSPMPFQVPSLYTPPFSGSPHPLQSMGQPTYPASARPMVLAYQSAPTFQSPPSAGSVNMAPWGFPETHPPISPSHCFDFEGYYSSTLTPDDGSQHSSPTIPELPQSAGGNQATMASSSAVIDPFLEVGHWGFEHEGARDCGHEQITPKAFEHGPISFDGGLLLGSNDPESTAEYQQMQQWMDTNDWSSHA